MSFSRKEHDHKYYLKNKEKLLKQSKEYWKLHKNDAGIIAGIKKARAKYQKTPKSFFKTINSNAQRRNLKVEITQEEFIKWFLQQKYCFYCDIPSSLLNEFVSGKYIKRLTVDRINNNLSYSLKNIVAACYRCNAIKSDYFSQEEMKQLAQQFIKPRWQKLALLLPV